MGIVHPQSLDGLVEPLYLSKQGHILRGRPIAAGLHHHAFLKALDNVTQFFHIHVATKYVENRLLGEFLQYLSFTTIIKGLQLNLSHSGWDNGGQVAYARYYLLLLMLEAPAICIADYTLIVGYGDPYTYP